MLKIISGGQSGVDRAALDTALVKGLDHGGWCPRGRRAEDGVIDPVYKLTETEADDYQERTQLNVLAADATLIIYSNRMSGGTALTYQLTGQFGKPCFLIDTGENISIDDVTDWLTAYAVKILNVAGPRASHAPLIYSDACNIVSAIIDAYDHVSAV